METSLSHKVIFVMGVSGCGKTSIGQRLAAELGVPFIDADDHHPKVNIDKMSQGMPLTDEDRKPWLEELNKIARGTNTGIIIACSALKEKYRILLMESIESKTIWIYLRGSFDLIYDRMNRRANHYMGANMLKSQFDALEEPNDAIIVNIEDHPDQIIKKLMSINEG
jgi:6-phosphogluconate dehydrogenase